MNVQFKLAGTTGQPKGPRRLNATGKYILTNGLYVVERSAAGIFPRRPLVCNSGSLPLLSNLVFGNGDGEPVPASPMAPER